MVRSKKYLEAMEAYDSDNEPLALRLMEACAEGGDPNACYTSALWCINGVGCDPDVPRGRHWLYLLESLAQQGNTVAQWELSGMLRWGDLLEEDIETANHWLDLAAEGGHADAQHLLGWYYETGQYGYLVNPSLSARWYQRAFEQGNPETLYLFAVNQLNEGKMTDDVMSLLRLAADKGFKQAARLLQTIQH